MRGGPGSDQTQGNWESDSESRPKLTGHRSLDEGHLLLELRAGGGRGGKSES